MLPSVVTAHDPSQLHLIAVRTHDDMGILGQVDLDRLIELDYAVAELAGVHGAREGVLGTGSAVEEQLHAVDIQPVGALHANLYIDGPFGRNEVIARILLALINMLEAYDKQGFAVWREQWKRYDRMLGRNVKVIRGGETITGMAMGIDSIGALMLDEGNGTVSRFMSGDVSLRLHP